jgi:hypothetical protein
MKKRGSIALVVALIIVVVLVAAGGVWYWKAHKSSANNSQSQSAATVQATSTYQNADYGVSFEYPSNLTVKPGDTAEGDYGLYTPYGPYQNASTTVSLITVEIPPSFYPGTNLEGAYFNLSVNKQLSQSQCLALTSQPGPNNGGGKTTIGGVTFNWTRAGSAAAGTDEFSENYSGYTNGTCYEFNLGDTTGNDVSPTGTRMSGSANDISVLEGVLPSVKFTGSAPSVKVTSENLRIPTSTEKLVSFDKYGIFSTLPAFVSTSSYAGGGEGPISDYSDGGTINMGKYAGYHLITGSVSFGLDGVATLLFATKDYQSFILDNSTSSQESLNFLEGEGVYLNVTKITGEDSLSSYNGTLSTTTDDGGPGIQF